MDDRRFDAIIRSLSRELSRRGTLRLLAGGAFGGLLTDFGAPHAEAKHFGCQHVGRPCNRSRQCCSGRCRGPKDRKTCRAHDAGICTTSQDTCAQGSAGNECGTAPGGLTCSCLVTTGGASFCAVATDCSPCTKDRQCYDGLVPGAACVVCASCSSSGGFTCAKPCPEPTS